MSLRDVREDDHPWLVELHNDDEVLFNVTDPTPITLEQHLAWWARVSQDSRQLRQVFEYGGERVGFAKFYAIDRENRCCVLGADIHRDQRGRGYAAQMWSLMLDKCFRDWRLHRVSLTTAWFNEKARHIYKKLGFREEGRLVQSLLRDGMYHDQVCMFMLREDWASSAVLARGESS